MAWSITKIFSENGCVIIRTVKSNQSRYIRDRVGFITQIFLTFGKPVIGQIFKRCAGQGTLKKSAAFGLADAGAFCDITQGNIIFVIRMYKQ